MRGKDEHQNAMFSYISPEQRMDDTVGIESLAGNPARLLGPPAHR